MNNIKNNIFLKKITSFLFLLINSILALINPTMRGILKKVAFIFIITFMLYSAVTFFIRFDRMPSNTMLETFEKKDLITTFKLKYAITIYPFISKLTEKTFVFSTPKRGDIVLVKDPKIREQGFLSTLFAYPLYFLTLGRINKMEDNYIVKRVIGLANESIEIIDKTVYINGEPLNEPWLKIHLDKRILNKESSYRDNFGPYIIGYNEYFLLSDNRDYGYDSRNFGSVSFRLINGKVISK